MYRWVTYNDNVTLVNNYGRPLFVTSSGGERNPICPASNSHAMYALVDGVQVVSTMDANATAYKTGFISFIVPAGSTYQVVSRPNSCAYGQFRLSAVTL